MSLWERLKAQTPGEVNPERFQRQARAVCQQPRDIY